MGLDWCIYTEEGEPSQCEIIGAKKVGELLSREQYLETFKDHYKPEYLEKIKTDDEVWKKTQDKYYCNACPAHRNNMCKECPEGSFACSMFGIGGCTYRGKSAAYYLSDAGHDSDICYLDCKEPEDWERLIAVFDDAIKDVAKTKEGKEKETLLKGLRSARFWLNWWYQKVQEHPEIKLNAWC